MGSPGELWTLNTLEYPSDAVVSSLSDVLEASGDVPQRYCLSTTACRGILRRAAKRGKDLPDVLLRALEQAAAASATSAHAEEETTPMSPSPVRETSHIA